MSSEKSSELWLAPNGKYDQNLLYDATLDLLPLGVAHATLDGRITLVNDRLCDLLGRPCEGILGTQLTSLLEPADGGPIAAATSALLSGEPPAAFEHRHVRGDMTSAWLRVTTFLTRNANGQPAYLVSVIEDISVRRGIQRKLGDWENLIKATIDTLPEHICVIDEQANVIMVNQAWNHYPVISHDALPPLNTHTNYLDICHEAVARGEESAVEFLQGLQQVLAGEIDEFTLEYPFNSSTEQRWFMARISRLPQPDPARILVCHVNVTQTRLAQDKVVYLAHYDKLTGLPNRLLFCEGLDRCLQEAKQLKQNMAVLFIDLDRFKMVNDTMGHSFGDRLLAQVGERIVHYLQGLDQASLVGRVGGDEFCISLCALKSDLQAAEVAAKLLSVLSEPFDIGGMETLMTPSIGITLYPLNGWDAETLVNNADTAMYLAKRMGRNNYQYFTAHLNQTIIERARIENHLRKALDRNELFLEYQPQTEIGSGRITGVEALMRWRNPELGMISPAVFIPIAEETGLIVALGEWAMQVACRQCKAWQTQGIAPLVMSVNLSARQFRHQDISETVERVLRETGLEGRYLELELTEGIVMGNAQALIQTMSRLKDFGVRLSLDDFGTGYSNLAYLKRFPLDTIKIDKSFIDDITKGQDEGMIAATVISLGHNLKLKVIAEGVETREQLDVLQALGCDMMQGYLFSRPLPADRITALLQNTQAQEN